MGGSHDNVKTGAKMKAPGDPGEKAGFARKKGLVRTRQSHGHLSAKPVTFVLEIW